MSKNTSVIGLLMLMTSTSYGGDAEIATRANRIVSAWAGWVAQHRVSQAGIAVSFQGEIVAHQGKGRKATTPAPIASMTKAITGICVAKLEQAGKLQFSSHLNSLIPALENDVTIASLLSHTSGFSTDITQRPPDTYPGRDKEYLHWVSEREIEAGQSKPEGTTHSYNNANYAMLGAAITAVTDKSYEQACNDLILKPAGIESATLNPEWRIMSSWGGWKISAVDYLKFVRTYFSDTQVMGKSPKDFPHHDFGKGASYGMGFVFRQGRHGGINVWHDGKWHADVDDEKHRFGAFFAKWDNGWAVATNHNFSAIDGEHGALDRLLATVAHQP